MGNANEGFFTEDIEIKDGDETTPRVEVKVETPPADPSADDSDDADTEGEGDDNEFDVDKAKEKIRRVNSEAKNLRKRVRELEAAQEEKLTGEQKLQARIGALESQLALAARKNIAAEAGLPSSWAERLQGADEEAWREDAEAVAAELKSLAKRANTTNNPGASRAGSGVKELSEAEAFFLGA